MHTLGTSRTLARAVSAEDVADLELSGTWVVDLRLPPHPTLRAGWLVDWEDDIAFLTDDPLTDALRLPWDHQAQDWPLAEQMSCPGWSAA